MDDADRQLKALGAGIRARLGEEADAGEAPAVEEERLRRFMDGALEGEEAQALEEAIAADPASLRQLALLIGEEAPLDPQREDAIVEGALGELRSVREVHSPRGALASLWDLFASLWRSSPETSASPGAVDEGATGEGARRRSPSDPGRAIPPGWWPALGVAAVAAAALAVAVLRGPVEVPGGTWSLTLSGEQSTWQGGGDDEPAALPVYGPSSRFEAVLTPEEEGADVEIAAWALLPGDQVVRLVPDGPGRALIGPGGIILRGDGRSLFGESSGEITLLVVVAAPGSLPSPTLEEGGRLQEGLLKGDARGDWRLIEARLRYASGR